MMMNYTLNIYNIFYMTLSAGRVTGAYDVYGCTQYTHTLLMITNEFNVIKYHTRVEIEEEL